MAETFIYRGVKIAIRMGDITEQEADALVNPANSMMSILLIVS